MRQFLLIAALLIWAGSAHAQIGFDGVSSHDGTTNSSFSWSHTVTSSTNTILQVGCSIVDTATAATVSSITYNGSNLTKLLSQPSSGFNAPGGQLQNRTESWMILAPATGTHTIVVTLAAGADHDAICGGVSFNRVNQSLTPDATASSSGVAGAMSGPPQPGTSITTTAAWDVVIDTVLNTGVTNPIPLSPAVRQWSVGSNGQGAASSRTVSTASSVTMAWTGMTNAWSQSVIALAWDGTLAPPATYYISPTGNDTNLGTSGSPWLTPNHPVNCGDLISAASGSYAYGNFRVGEWGPVTCINGNNVAWLKCATFDACKININATGNNAMAISQSYWGIQGWEVTASTVSTNLCFETFPPNATTQIHHIIFANDIANGCGDGGFGVGGIQGPPNYGVDYTVFIGDIAYNGAQDNANCYSGIDMIPPTNSDTLPGTHIYIAGNFAWGNVDPNPCGGGLPTDGQGPSIDSPSVTAYSGQIVIDNNISIFNGATGVQTFDNTGNTPNALTYIRQNTTYGNQTGSTNANPCAEININLALSTEVYFNLVQAGSNLCVTPGPVNRTEYALGSSSDGTSDVFHHNFIYSAGGNNTNTSSALLVSNVSGTNPNFANPVVPGAPSCSSFASVPACMATVIANFTPTAAGAKPYGYHVPTTTSIYDPLYPQWLCTVTNLPTGLVTPGCVTGTAIGNATIGVGVTIK